MVEEPQDRGHRENYGEESRNGLPPFLNEYDSEKPYPPGGVEGKGKRAHVEEGVLVVNCSPAQQPQETCTPLPALTPTPVCPAEIEEPQNGDTFFVGEEVTFTTSGSALRAQGFNEGDYECSYAWQVTEGEGYPMAGWGPDFQTKLLSEGTVQVEIIGSNGETGTVVVEAKSPEIEFVRMWETKNPANKIFDNTRKDEPDPISKNTVYHVVDPESGRCSVSLMCSMKPVENRDRFVCAVYLPDENGDKKLEGTDKLFGNQLSTVVDFSPVSRESVANYVLKSGYDVNGNGTLQDDEVIPMWVEDAEGNKLGPPTIKAISESYYGDSYQLIHKIIRVPEEFPVVYTNTSRLLRIFRDGSIDNLPDKHKPQVRGSFTLDCFGGELSEWLTHNAGAFFDDGQADIVDYYWGRRSALSIAVAESRLVRDAAQALYESFVEPELVDPYKANMEVGMPVTFPLPGYIVDRFPVPHEHEGPDWVLELGLGRTVIFTPKLSDLAAAIGRGRLVSAFATYRVEKTPQDEIEVISAELSGELVDLYDFSFEADSPAREAASLQLGFGGGQYSRTEGKIYRHTVYFDKDVPHPFD